MDEEDREDTMGTLQQLDEWVLNPVSVVNSNFGTNGKGNVTTIWEKGTVAQPLAENRMTHGATF
jgi:hypothetical protein